MFWGSLAITAGMVLLGLYVALRPQTHKSRGVGRRFVVLGGLVFPGVVVIALLIYGFAPGYALVPHDDDEQFFRVEIVAHQWWWEVIYPDVGGAPLLDANEIHVPVGRPLLFVVTGADVIHSFWVPKLGGKIDAIPGHRNRIVLQADATGVYRGQCSEFCGAQHARMGFHLEAHEPAALEARLQRLASRSRPHPRDSDLPGARGFAEHCAECHSIDARARAELPGPNLAGVADRHRLAAGWLRNDAAMLRHWLRDHQQIKPGNRMPDHSHLEPELLEQIAEFLEQAP